MSGILQSFAALIILGLVIALLLGAIAVRRSYDLTIGIAGAGLILSLAALVPAMQAAPLHTALFLLDRQTLGFCGLILLCTLAVLVLGASYFHPFAVAPREEFFLLLLLASFGAMVLALSANVMTLFLGIETMGLAMIGMIAYPHGRPEALEAGLKYLVLAGLSSAAGLFGIGLILLATGSLALPPGPSADPGSAILLLAGLVLLGVAAGFKLSVVPFHMWVPDIYAGAPAPAAAYVAVVPKIAVLAVAMRLLQGAALTGGVALALTIIAAASMLTGNLLALLQENMKRILGYSSISHLGNILFAILAAGAIGRLAAMFYIVTYAVTVIAAFGVIGVISSAGAARDTDGLLDLRGLFWTRPILAALMTFAMLSLAGIPPAIGFIAKMYIMAAGINADLMVLVATMVAASVLGLFFYLRIIIVMLQTAPQDQAALGGVLAIPGAGMATISVCGALILGFGVDPGLLTALLKVLFP
jgi:NADH-quinone oxidoreductase subunit N